MTWDPTRAEHRSIMRDLIGDGVGIDFRNVAAVLGVAPTHEAVMAALDGLDNAERPLSPVDPAAYDWPELAKTLADEVEARREERRTSW